MLGFLLGRGDAEEELLARVDVLLGAFLSRGLHVNVGISGLKVLEKLVWPDLAIQTQAPVNIDRALHVAALVHDKVLLLVLAAALLVHEGRNPSAFCSQCFSTALLIVDKTATAALDCQVRVEHRIKRLAKSCAGQILRVSLHVCSTWLDVVLQWSHQKLSWKLIDTGQSGRVLS